MNHRAKNPGETSVAFNSFKTSYLDSYIIMDCQFDFICDNNNSSTSMKLLATCLSSVILSAILVVMILKKNKKIQ